MSDTASYTKSEQNSVRRHRERGAYDYATVHSIVNSCAILHVSFVPTSPSTNEFPTILPMIGSMASFSNPNADPSTTPLDLYLHGHAAARLMKLPSEAGEPGLPVCVAATHLDGIVLALTPFNHSCNYRSAVLFGHAVAVTDDAERTFAMHRITDGLVPDRWNNTRVPPTKGELQSTGVLRVSVQSASAKIRASGVSDVKKDLNDEEVAGKVWAGVVPVWQTLGPPVEGSKNRVSQFPEYLKNWRECANKEAEEYATKAAVDPQKEES